MSTCYPFRPVPGQRGPRGCGPVPAPPFDPRDYWATKKFVSSLVSPIKTSVTNLQETKLDRSDVVDPAVATEAGKAADAKKTQDELTRISGVASDAKTLAESKADKLSSRQLEAVNSGIDAGKVAKIAQNETAISAEVSRATTEEARLQALISAIKTFDAVVADSLPSPSEQYSKKLYLIPSTNPETRNVKDEFICVKTEDVWGWEQVGSTAITIEFDNEPTEGSQKAARSGGIWSFVNGIIGSLTLGWEKITGKPSTFPPSDHSHAQSQVTGLAGALAGKLPSVLSKTDALSVENPDPLELPIPMIEYTVLDLVAAKKGWIWNGYAKFNNLRGKPTTLAGYGITDAATKADVDGKANLADIPSMVPEIMSAEGISNSGINISGSISGQTIRDQYGYLREAIDGKADKTIPSSAGNLAELTADGNLADSGIANDRVVFSSDILDNPITLAYGSGEGLYLGRSYGGLWGHWLVYGVSAPWFIDRNGQLPTDPREPATIGDISAENPTFSNAVLAVGLNIDTNSVAVLNEIAETFGGFPIEGTATTVGGLLAALAAAIAWLKKNKVGSFASVGGATATVENGVAKLNDFFTESNSLMTRTIDDRLPIPISAKSAGFTAESYKRFVVTVGGDMTVTLHTPTSGDAEIFECRFNGASLSADASITFAGATATTMDTDCGTVKAGKVSLMSAFWNGSTWDVNWKVEG